MVGQGSQRLPSGLCERLPTEPGGLEQINVLGDEVIREGVSYIRNRCSLQKVFWWIQSTSGGCGIERVCACMKSTVPTSKIATISWAIVIALTSQAIVEVEIPMAHYCQEAVMFHCHILNSDMPGSCWWAHSMRNMNVLNNVLNCQSLPQCNGCGKRWLLVKWWISCTFLKWYLEF